MGETLNGLKLDDVYLHFTLLVVFLVILSSLIELLLHHISHKVKENKYRHVAEILNCVYKELMVLGMIGFLLFIANETNMLDFSIGSEEGSDDVVEFVHFMLFLLGVFYIMLVGFSLILVVQRSFNTWDLQEEMYDEKIDDAEAAPHVPLKWYETFTKFSLFKKKLRNCYYEIRKKFIEYNNLPHEFDFARYLRKCMRKQIVTMLHIDKYMWGALLIVVALNAIRVSASGPISVSSSLAAASILAWALLVLYMCLFIYVVQVFWKVAGFKYSHEVITGDISELFFLRRPQLVFRAIQMCTFLQAFYLSVYVLAFSEDIFAFYPARASWIVFLVTVLPPFISVGFFVPQIFPMYIICCSTYNLSNKVVIQSTFKEIIKANHKTIVGFSYAEEWEHEKQFRGSVRLSGKLSHPTPGRPKDGLHAPLLETMH